MLVLLTDMTLSADALAIVSNRMDQIPSKDSMTGSLYSDLAKIYEKAVQLPNGGSITIIAVTTLSGGDITHAIPDLSLIHIFSSTSTFSPLSTAKYSAAVNTTENPPVERLLVPDMALTAAEYFAVDKGEKVLVLLTDMTRCV